MIEIRWHQALAFLFAAFTAGWVFASMLASIIVWRQRIAKILGGEEGYELPLSSQNRKMTRHNVCATCGKPIKGKRHKCQ